MIVTTVRLMLSSASPLSIRAKGLGVSDRASTSRYLNLLQAEMKGLGVLRSPMPTTIMPDSRRREARRVKSESEDTSAKPSTFPE